MTDETHDARVQEIANIVDVMAITAVELLTAVHERATEQSASTKIGEAKREFALAKTAIEDAQMRYTRGMAFALGRFEIADLEKPE